MRAFPLDGGDLQSSSWRRAGRCGVDAVALLLPQDLGSVASVTPGIRLFARAGLPTDEELARLAAGTPVSAMSHAALHGGTLSIWPPAQAQADDRVGLVQALFAEDEWRLHFHLWRRRNPNLEAAPARLCILLALSVATAAPRRLSFHFDASQQMPQGGETVLAAFETEPLELVLVS